jgi:hypothetical protein
LHYKGFRKRDRTGGHPEPGSHPIPARARAQAIRADLQAIVSSGRSATVVASRPAGRVRGLPGRDPILDVAQPISQQLGDPANAA